MKVCKSTSSDRFFEPELKTKKKKFDPEMDLVDLGF